MVDGSTRSSHSNAYCYGWGNNRRIVLYDKLLQQMSETEVRDGLPSGWLLAGCDCSLRLYHDCRWWQWLRMSWSTGL